jgi:glycosyltransferase involved in cell wall biosynthesis
MGGGGVTRIAKFCKYLPENNWIPIALTVRNYDLPLRDDTLLKEIYKTQIYRTNTIDPTLLYNKSIKKKRYEEKKFLDNKLKKESGLTDFIKKIINNLLFIPDSRIGWLPFAVQKGIKISKTADIDLIFSTGGPWTNHLIGLMLKAFTKLPWIADFRDPWTDNILFPYSFKPKRIIEEKMEKAVLSKADKVIGATHLLTNKLKCKYSLNNSDKFNTITNGYDISDFKNVSKNIWPNNEKFTIVYTGNFYSLQNPKFFLKALYNLISEKPSLKDKIKVIFAGHWENWNKKAIKDLNLQNIIKYIGFISRPSAIELLSKGHVALLIVAKEGKGILTGKVFDYIASRRTILALVPEDGIVADLIRQTRSGVVVDAENILGIKDQILELYNKFRNKELQCKPDLSKVKRYDRKSLTANLSELFDKTIRNRA